MVVITKTSSHEPARQPASQASQLAIPPPSQPPASRPASQPATASQPASGGRRCRQKLAEFLPNFKRAKFLAEFLVEANSDKFGKFLLPNSASFLVPTKTNSASFRTKTCRILADGNLQHFPFVLLRALCFVFFSRNSASFLPPPQKIRPKNRPEIRPEICRIRHRIRQKNRPHESAPQNGNSAVHSAPNSASLRCRPPARTLAVWRVLAGWMWLAGWRAGWLAGWRAWLAWLAGLAGGRAHNMI